MEIKLSAEDWAGFANLKDALNSAPIQKVAELKEEWMKSGARRTGGDYQRIYEELPWEVRAAICVHWTREDLIGLNNVFLWMKQQINEGTIQLLPLEETPAAHFDSQGRQTDSPPEGNPHPET